jgi:hypothetical protein
VHHFDNIVFEIQRKWSGFRLMAFSLMYKYSPDIELEIKSDHDLFGLNSNDITLKLVSACLGFSKYRSKEEDALKVVHFQHSSLTTIEANNDPFSFSTMEEFESNQSNLDEVVGVQQELHRRISVIDTTKASEYTMREFISPVLIGALRLVKGVSMMCEKRIVGKFGHGPVDYAMTYQCLNIVLTEAKKQDIEGGIVQNIVQQQASHEMFSHILVPIGTAESERKRKFDEVYGIVSQIPTYGIVTNGREWQFLKLQRFRNSDGHIVTKISQSTRYSLELNPEKNSVEIEAQFLQVKKLLFVISGILHLQISAVDNNQQFQSMKKILPDNAIESLSANFSQIVEEEFNDNEE